MLRQKCVGLKILSPSHGVYDFIIKPTNTFVQTYKYFYIYICSCWEKLETPLTLPVYQTHIYSTVYAVHATVNAPYRFSSLIFSTLLNYVLVLNSPNKKLFPAFLYPCHNHLIPVCASQTRSGACAWMGSDAA